MKKIISYIIILLIICSLIGCASSRNSIITADDIFSNLKFYQNDDYGYEIGYPQDYEMQISGGHSPIANPEYGMRLSLYSKGKPSLDIDSIDKANYKDKYQNIEEFINYKHLNIKFDEDVILDDKQNKIYKLDGDNYYFSFFENNEYIFELSSSSKDLLKLIMVSFKFI